MNDMLTFLQHYRRVGGATSFLQYDVTNKLFICLFEVFKLLVSGSKGHGRVCLCFFLFFFFKFSFDDAKADILTLYVLMSSSLWFAKQTWDSPLYIGDSQIKIFKTLSSNIVFA